MPRLDVEYVIFGRWYTPNKDMRTSVNLGHAVCTDENLEEAVRARAHVGQLRFQRIEPVKSVIRVMP